MSTEFRTASNRHFRSIPSVESILAIVIVLAAGWLASTYEFRTAPYSDLTGRLFDQHLRVLQGEAGNPDAVPPTSGVDMGFSDPRADRARLG